MLQFSLVSQTVNVTKGCQVFVIWGSTSYTQGGKVVAKQNSDCRTFWVSYKVTGSVFKLALRNSRGLGPRRLFCVCVQVALCTWPTHAGHSSTCQIKTPNLVCASHNDHELVIKFSFHDIPRARQLLLPQVYHTTFTIVASFTDFSTNSFYCFRV